MLMGMMCAKVPHQNTFSNLEANLGRPPATVCHSSSSPLAWWADDWTGEALQIVKFYAVSTTGKLIEPEKGFVKSILLGSWFPSTAHIHSPAMVIFASFSEA